MPNGYTKYGDGTYEFALEGVAVSSIKTACGIVPQKLQVGGTPEFTAEGLNEHGLTVTDVTADDMFDGTLEGYLTDKTTFFAAKSFTLDGRFFIVKGRDHPREVRTMTKVTLTVRSYKLITGESA